ncbi:hypothetical protein BJ138DRAFT_1155389 [Hygrophoropsis aurantiaca]|uniref:Uncharacterized protein n=1 Tax=Hygrophoropsis aurantiaca TaxID=72124 RepID=A0ACB8A7C1_9AGAM|nr:hypothetical protein BJ138DRAFT_1155389 [Hygrophoropsis aurantiaca]
MSALEALIIALSGRQAANYIIMASGAVVIYDQILNFSQEVDLVWNRRWSIVTLLYFVARYCGSAAQLGFVAALVRINWTSME